MASRQAMVSLLAALSFFLSGETDAATITLGQCRNASVVQDFQPKRYEGLWFEVSRSIAILELDGKCAKLQYQLNEITGDFAATYTIIRNGKEKRLSAVAVPINATKKEGRYRAVVDVATLYILADVKVSSPYLILDTDYDHFAVIYACVDRGIANSGGVVVLSREPVLAQPYKERITAVLERQGLSDKTLVDLEQSCGKY